MKSWDLSANVWVYKVREKCVFSYRVAEWTKERETEREREKKQENKKNENEEK